ncbi:hypothetical protein [Dolichospermum sp. UHCC 0259]|uniref:beta strand repeat-containing protein n=1 Tax=Dolichospermum sp. UHCC 0259 TaxID=2590010 RepID=UPI001447FC5D|nr:hypothetical protein [Dolichospermum sp. UHCC 0259]MTJ48264.1 hypothetical protein [Dolichospermum sp. UHCC 0259]
MKTPKKFLSRKQSQLFRSLIATAFIANGFFPFVAPAFAEGTTAGTQIDNRATATYEDPNVPNTPINSTSNTVRVVIAEVAGITVTGSGINNLTNPGGAVQPGNFLSYTFTVTNVGNSPTQFQIPNVSTTTGPVTVSGTLPGSTTPGQLQYSTDGGTNWINVPTSGLTTAAVPVNGSVLVRVPVTVQNSAVAGETITARLGQTPGDAQNQARVADGGDVFTVDADPVNGAPINGVREASATQNTTVGATPQIKALATILKTRTAYAPGSTAVLNDDVITYGLNLRVEDNDVTNSGQIPAPLIGTSIQLDTTTTTTGTAAAAATRILVSDAVPANTVLNSTPTAPTGWQVVYSTQDPTTINANAATWTTNAPALNTVRRVGFINNPATITSVSPGVTVSGFSIQVVTSSIPLPATTATTIDNIAQVFGQTSGDPNNVLVYDASGDQTPSNYNGTTFVNTPDNGFNTKAASGTDPANNNTGAANDGNGEYNTLDISVPNAVSLVNGPNNAPDAVGPTNNNDDFTNKSAIIDEFVAPGSTINPSPVTFTNTVKNTGGSAANISLLPTAPATATDLPNDTLVTISYQSLRAAYTYNNATGFTFVPGSGVGTVGGLPITASNPVRIDNVASNATDSYGVSVDLPNPTALSTDTNMERGFPVPVTAFIDTVTVDGLVTAGEANNITIDRVYTGFLQLLKTSRLLQGTGPAINGTDGTFSTAQKRPQPGNIIEYRITYKNISTPVVGTGNVILNADKVVITENGVLAPNNWARDNDLNQQIDTSNVVGSATDSGASTITFFNGDPATTPTGDVTGVTSITDVTRYVNSVTGQIAPGSAARTFTFQRKVN